MTSKLDRSAAQQTRRTNEALELLKWIAENLGHDEFTEAEILDDMPLEDPVKSDDITKCEQNVARLTDVFHRLFAKQLVGSVGNDRYVLTDLGKRKAVEHLRDLAQAVYAAANRSSSILRWPTLGGQPFGENRTKEELEQDMLVNIYISIVDEQYHPEFRKDRFIGQYKLDNLHVRQKLRRQHLNDRGRRTAALKWLEKQGFVESPDDDGFYTISIKGDQYLEQQAA